MYGVFIKCHHVEVGYACGSAVTNKQMTGDTLRDWNDLSRTCLLREPSTLFYTRLRAQPFPSLCQTHVYNVHVSLAIEGAVIVLEGSK